MDTFVNRVEHRGQRDVDVLSLAGGPAMRQRGQHRDGGMQPRVDVRVRQRIASARITLNTELLQGVRVNPVSA